MNTVKYDIEYTFKYIKAFVKWFFIALVVGALGGVVGSVFHICIDKAASLRTEHFPMLVLALPIGGIIITAFYNLFKRYGHVDTNRVIEAVQKNETVPLVMIPLIFLSTVITHLLGGSAGREGVALQLGGSIGYNFGRLIKLRGHELNMIVMTGMSSVFAALFGTPLTAAVFAIEVTSVGLLHYAAFLPCFIAALTAFEIASAFGIEPVSFALAIHDEISVIMLLKTLALAALCVMVSILFCTAISKFKYYFAKYIKNAYIRAFVGGVLIVVLTLLVGSQDYNGAGVPVIAKAIAGEARSYDFIFKIVFTALTIASGFKGGEIVPTFFIGSTFGCIAGSFLGLDPCLAAALGFVALFCCVVNCPIASIILSIEVFGTDGLLFFAFVCSVCYMLSGCFGLYKSQKIVYSKLDDEYIDVNAH